ncbi:hypothetical protein H5410_026845 [Solanum commersonii]|uniref:Uncharacterized protein n=1 Tax=Solanum commersonii TaxID=4109 RepID=A0A9J5YXN3_SOLCO|nr:hypothetical protein H5410_026845 [Solanum commersonii]
MDLTSKLPKQVKINEEDDDTGHIKYKWIQVHYNYMPNYCQECCLQGHDEQECWTIHPELYDERREEEKKGEYKERDKIWEGTVTNQKRILASGKVAGTKHNRQEWTIRQRNKYKRDKFGRIEGDIEYHNENSFETLREEGVERKEEDGMG